MDRQNRLAGRQRGGFTLIEILVVIAIMIIMMGIAMFGFVDWGRGQGIRTSVLNFRNTFSHARQHAITHRVRTQLHYGNMPPPGPPPGPGTPPWRGYYYVSTEDDGILGTTNVFPEGVIISNGAPIVVGPYVEALVEFKLDGSCALDTDGDGPGDEWNFGSHRSLYIIEGGRSLTTTNYLQAQLTIFRHQGSIKRADE